MNSFSIQRDVLYAFESTRDIESTIASNLYQVSFFFLSMVKVAQSCLNSLWSHGVGHDWSDCSPWNSPGQNTGVGSLSLLQGIFPTQGSNPGLPHCRWILYQLSHKGSPRILEWVAYPFSSGSFWLRNWTGVSCISNRFFTNWAIREALSMILVQKLQVLYFQIVADWKLTTWVRFTFLVITFH